MKSKLPKILLCFLTVAILFTNATPFFAQGAIKTLNEAQHFVEGIISYQQNKSGVNSVQEWINNSLAKNAGSSSEWYVIALSQYGKYDFSSYEKSLLNYLDNNEIGSASSRQKYALTLISCGSTDTYIYNVLNNSIGQQGVMSWIFGLHLLNNGYTSNNQSLTAVKQKLLSLQLSDGGWAVMGNYGDVDVTAMSIQALAPYYKTDTTVKNSINKALTFLSEKQKENGDWASYGVNNPESTAQVLVALSSLGIDCENDNRFIKNGNTLFDGISLYRLSDGSFCHKQGESSNSTATVQVFYSMVSYIRMKNGQSPFYILDKRNPKGLVIPNPGTSNSDKTNNASGTVETSDNKTTSQAINKATATDSSTSGKNSSNADSDNKSDSVQGTTSASTEKSDSSNNTEEQQNSTVKISAEETNSQDITTSTASSVENKKAVSASTDENTGKSYSYKIWVSITILLIALIICLILYCRKKRNSRNFIVVGIFTAVAIVITLTTNFQSNDSYYNQADTNNENTIGTVSITIRCDTIPDKSAEHIPDDGTILDVCEFEINEGDTVYDVLSEATAKNKIHLETNGNDSSIYVEGINNIYEFDFGDLSGWMYFVNGESPSVSCGEYVLSDSDEIQWLYTCDIGKDLEN